MLANVLRSLDKDQVILQVFLNLSYKFDLIGFAILYIPL